MKKIILKLIPKPIQKKLLSIVQNYIQIYREQIAPKYQVYELKSLHIKNAKLLVNREELLKILPKYGVIAELGVDEGFFTEKI